MWQPQAGDVILRGSISDGFIVLDGSSRRYIAGPLMLVDALAAARSHGTGEIWQESVDDRGRPLGPPARVAAS